MEFDTILDAEDDPGDGRWFVVRGGSVLDSHPEVAVGVDLEVAAGFESAEPPHVIARAGGVTYWAVGVDDDARAPDGYDFRDLYSLHAVASATEWALAGRAVQIIDWARTTRFCGRCGTPTVVEPDERAVRCPACSLLAFPRISPAVITLVHRGQEVLLARGVRFTQPMYSTLAGFVEPGESIEHAVVREVREEVGVEVGSLQYMGSQPWPFPHSLMLGFYAEWQDGEILIDETEILEAAWFPRDALPVIPPPISIAHQMITRWAAGLAT